MTATLKFKESEHQFMVDAVHYFGKDELTRKSLKDFAAYYGMKWAPSFIVKNESCKSATRGSYHLPVKRLKLHDTMQPSPAIIELMAIQDENNRNDMYGKTSKPLPVMQMTQRQPKTVTVVSEPVVVTTMPLKVAKKTVTKVLKSKKAVVVADAVLSPVETDEIVLSAAS
jgi:hypothetical protein